MWMFCEGYVEEIWMFCGCYVEHCGGMWIFLWSNMDVMWTLHIATFHNLTKSSPLLGQSSWNKRLWINVEQCGCLVEKCGCNVDPPHLYISQFDLSPPWSVILKYAIVDVMWIHQISHWQLSGLPTLFVGYTVQCICYQSLGLVSGVSTVP